MGRDDYTGQRTFDRQLFNDQGVGDVIEPSTTIFLRNKNTQHAKAAEFGNCLAGKLMCPVGFDADSVEFVTGVAPGDIARPALSLSKFQIHASYSAALSAWRGPVHIPRLFVS